ncbi:MAG TPA: DUF3089 domain-containing protein [Panacibacter sp.]|nr:DUF3089 domain-containing protein [Panacibacter sp.]
MQRIILFLIIIVCFVNCTPAQKAQTEKIAVNALPAPDYSDINNWAAHPWKRDPSDSLPTALRKSYHPDSTVDIFFLHPTSYLDKAMPFGYNAPVDDAVLNKKTDATSILYQASIFNEAGRVFAPRYRQANYYAYFPTDTAAAITAFNKAYDDIKAAFEYYLQHYNNGRPIVIASHSQGSTHAKRLIKEFFDGKPLQNQLVAAYLVGMPIEPDYLSNIPACSSPSQTGCVCSWRTFKEGHIDTFIQKEKFTAIVTNPLTWDAAKPEVSRKENRGSVLLKFNKLVPCVANAQVHNGVLWTVKPHFFGNIFYTNPNYHIADYNLYYLSVRQNVQERINAFLKK